MRSPKDIIKTLFPDGTRGKTKSVVLYPRWPPDLFGAMAYLLQFTDSYTDLLDQEKGISDKELKILIAFGEYWRSEDIPAGVAHRFMQEQWKIIINEKRDFYLDPKGDSWRWMVSAIKLFIIADTACSGVGFYYREQDNSWIQKLHYLINSSKIEPSSLKNQSHPRWYQDVAETVARSRNYRRDREKAVVRNTACLLIPERILCVQPKTRTPSVGCTLRSMSHNLALLPGSGQIEVIWNDNPYAGENTSSSFNILVVPFPFKIQGRDICRVASGNSKHGLFDVRQSWLENSDRKQPEIIEQIINLILNAHEHVHTVDMVLLPEMALNDDIFDKLIVALKRKFGRDIQLVISGVRRERKGKVQNIARSNLNLKVGGITADQKKHHRWKLDQNQIRMYSFSDALNPSTEWWEGIDIQKRVLDFVAFSEGSCYTTLICEDLARVDPCQSAIRAIGPNLVFALLMDGPQLNGRWPERYALSLSDDPGCSVLTVTSLGMIERSNHHFNSSSRAIALWKDTETGTSEVELPAECSAVLLNLTAKNREEITLDGRSDGGTAVNWVLTGKTPL